MGEGRRVVIVQNSRGSSPGRLPGWLADEGLDPVVVAGADLPQQVPDLAGVDGLVLLGGGFLPTDDELKPFLAHERHLAREAIDAEVPVLGICLGAQLLAVVAGGEVTPTSGETERGPCSVRLLPAASADPLLGDLVDDGELRMLQSHYDSVTALPPDATHLATSDACQVQAFRIGSAAWGVQFHPEAAMAGMAGWDEARLAADGFDKAALIAQGEADHEANTAQARALVGAFAAIVRSGAGG